MKGGGVGEMCGYICSFYVNVQNVLMFCSQIVSVCTAYSVYSTYFRSETEI